MKRIVALVTLFNPNIDVTENMTKLAIQVSHIILLDNSKNSNSSLFDSINNCTYIYNHANLGLSRAFNKSFELDVVKNSEFIIYFDQDSSIPEGFINNLVKDFQIVLENTNAGCMGPQYFDTNANQIINPRSKKEIIKGIYSVNTIITSSMISTYDIMKNIGFWNESVFLDMADWDICWRMHKHGYEVILDTNLTLTHTLGKGIKKIGLFSIRLNNPIREYYQIRDSIKLSKEDYVPFKYRIRFLIMWFIMPIVYITFCPERQKRISLVFKAFKDGLSR